MSRLADPADELFRHRPETPQPAPGWAERTYHLLTLDDLIVNVGRALWADRTRTAFACVSTPLTQHVHREATGPSAEGPDDPQVGAVRVEVLEPLRRVRVRAEDPASRFAFDLLYEARTPALIPSPNRIAQDGRVVTEYTNFFQSGSYSGWLSLDGRRRRVDGRTGFRDRGWGRRKHEGSPRRGLVLFCSCELPDRVVQAGFYETAQGERARTFGWSAGADGSVAEVTALEHRLRLAGGELEGGDLRLGIAGDGERRLEFEVLSRAYLRVAGYSVDAADRRPGSLSYDLSDPSVVRGLRGQVDCSCRFSLDGETVGHGFVEVGIGEHRRYRSRP